MTTSNEISNIIFPPSVYVKYRFAPWRYLRERKINLEIIIHGRHLDVTEAIRNYVEKKASKLTKYSNRINKVQFTLKIEGQNHISEAVCSIAGATLVAEAANADMYAAIDLGMDKLEKQLVRQREKLKNHKGSKKGGKITESGEIAEGGEIAG